MFTAVLGSTNYVGVNSGLVNFIDKMSLEHSAVKMILIIDKMNVSFLFRASVCSESKQGWVKSQLIQIFGPNDNKLAMKLFGSKKALMRPKVGCFSYFFGQILTLKLEGSAKTGSELGDSPNVPVQVSYFYFLQFYLYFYILQFYFNLTWSLFQFLK